MYSCNCYNVIKYINCIYYRYSKIQTVEKVLMTYIEYSALKMYKRPNAEGL